MTLLNEAMIVRGLPILKHCWGFRPYTRINKIVFSKSDQASLRKLVQPGNAVFLTPNHPWFFADWMIDKHVLDRVAPNAANWAAGSIVNGMGSMMQRFWRANNLIAQGTTNPNDAREHSVAWAAKGYGVLLHCEGQVGWNSDHIDTLHPGIIEMGVQCHKHMGVGAVYAAPLIWKTMFTKDVSSGLMREYHYICKRLKIIPEKVDDPSQAAWHLYDTLFSWKEEQWLAHSPTDKPFKERHRILTLSLIDILKEHVSIENTDTPQHVVRKSKKWLAPHKKDTSARHASYNIVKEAAGTLEKVLRVKSCTWEDDSMSQENVADHLKRIRSDYCKGSLRDTINQFAPRAVGPCVTFIKVPEPLKIEFDAVPDEMANALQERMQYTLDSLVDVVEREHGRVFYYNPFYAQ